MFSLCALAAGVLLLSSSALANEWSGVLTGTVVDAQSGKPIARATVTVHPGSLHARTDRRGQ